MQVDVYIGYTNLFIHHEMVAQKKQRQTEYNETYTQITIKHYKRDLKKLIFYGNLSAIYLIT